MVLDPSWDKAVEKAQPCLAAFGAPLLSEQLQGPTFGQLEHDGG